MTRLDENRGKAQIANKLGVTAGEVKNLAIWGNHSNTMFPDFYHASVGGSDVISQVGEEWGQGDFMQTVSTRKRPSLWRAVPPVLRLQRPLRSTTCGAGGSVHPKESTPRWLCGHRASTASPRA